MFDLPEPHQRVACRFRKRMSRHHCEGVGGLGAADSGSRRSDASNRVTAVGAVGERCRLNSRSNLNILSEARVRAPKLISHQLSVDPIDEKLCPSLVSREVRR
jgi:hypothetical protein